MAATGFTPIQLYRTSTASAVPVNTNLADGELAINTTDEKLYFKNAGGTVKLLASTSGASGDVVGPASATDGAVVAFDGVTGKLIKQASVTGTGNVVLATSPTLVTPALGTPASGNLSNTTADGTNAVGYRNIPASADKTGSYSLATTDVGKVISVGTGGLITVPDATFASGDAVLIFNNTSAAVTLTMSITTAYIAGTDADKATISLATRGIANILFVSGTICTVTGNVS